MHADLSVHICYVQSSHGSRLTYVRISCIFQHIYIYICVCVCVYTCSWHVRSRSYKRMHTYRYICVTCNRDISVFAHLMYMSTNIYVTGHHTNVLVYKCYLRSRLISLCLRIHISCIYANVYIYANGTSYKRISTQVLPAIES